MPLYPLFRYLLAFLLLMETLACADSSDTKSTHQAHRATSANTPKNTPPNLTQPWKSLPELQKALHLAVRFYGAQRCGDSHNWTLKDAPEGHSCHLEDGKIFQHDVSGGWHDAGDFIKWSRNNAWSAYLLLKAFDTYPESFQDLNNPQDQAKPNGIPDILDEVKFATDFLLKILSSDGRLLSRVGGNQDHDFLYTSPQQSKMPEAQGGGNRPMYYGAKADVAGIAAAALALMAKAYAPYDSNYAQICRQQAEKLYAYGIKNPGSTPDNFYPEGQCNGNSWDAKNWDGPKCKGVWIPGKSADAMMCGAIELYRLNPKPNLLQEAKIWMQKNSWHEEDLSWMEYSDPCWHSLVQSKEIQTLNLWQRTIKNYQSKVSSQKETVGLVYFHPWGSLRIATHAGFSLALYAQQTGDTTALRLAQQQLYFALGDNPYQRSFLVGWGHNPPQNPMHKNAWGLQENWDLVSKTPPRTPLVGALVGGPKGEADSGFPAGYQDNPLDYVGNEVSIYYNAGLVALLAFEIHQHQNSKSP